MQRLIKFRAWDSTRNNMNYKVCVGNTDFSDKNYTCSTILIDGEWLHFDDYHKIVTMQYTGLKDKNGGEIYEGDIVKYFTNYYGNKQERKKVVEWVDDMQDDSFGEPLSMGYRFHGSEIEVIGNIYENPELLEAGEWLNISPSKTSPKAYSFCQLANCRNG